MDEFDPTFEDPSGHTFHTIPDDGSVGLDDGYAEKIATDLICPEANCGAPMELRKSRFGFFYGCTRYPDCRGTHGAKSDGSPLGIPADKETRQARIAAHHAFDRLWNEHGWTRGQAYAWLADFMALPPGDAHIACFNKAQCLRLIDQVFGEFPKLKTSWDNLLANCDD
jgi:ssDNA-binding Zn-finger/Zn-ribbon topoisomerase 1